MKYLKLLNIIPISFFIFTLLALPVMAGSHQIDGNLIDWGIDLTKAYDGGSGVYKGTDIWWIPAGIPQASDIDFVVENNAYTGWSNHPMFYWTGGTIGYGITGTHKQKIGTSNDVKDYEEPLIHCTDQNRDYVQPSGGEAYDVEALYFDDDNTNVYLAIVTSLSTDGTSDGFKMGDIALDIKSDIKGTVRNKDNTISDSDYEYGIKVVTGNNIGSGSIIYQPLWNKPRSDEFPEEHPFTILSGTPAGTANTLVYSNQYVPSDNGKPNYVIEVSIPKQNIGSPSQNQLANLHLTIGCGNDLIELEPVRFKYNVPEFPTIVLPTAAIMGIILILGRRNKD